MFPRTLTKAERDHTGRVRALGCYLCRLRGYGPTEAQIHHIRYGNGMGQRSSHFLTVPICEKHHANYSPDGWHGMRKEWKLAGVDEMDALADTLKRLLT